MYCNFLVTSTERWLVLWNERQSSSPPASDKETVLDGLRENLYLWAWFPVYLSSDMGTLVMSSILSWLQVICKNCVKTLNQMKFRLPSLSFWTIKVYLVISTASKLFEAFSELWLWTGLTLIPAGSRFWKECNVQESSEFNGGQAATVSHSGLKAFLQSQAHIMNMWTFSVHNCGWK